MASVVMVVVVVFVFVVVVVVGVERISLSKTYRALSHLDTNGPYGHDKRLSKGVGSANAAGTPNHATPVSVREFLIRDRSQSVEGAKRKHPLSPAITPT